MSAPAEVWCASCKRPTAVILTTEVASVYAESVGYCEGHGLRELRYRAGDRHSAATRSYLGWVDCPTCDGSGVSEAHRCRLCGDREEVLLA